MISMRTVLQVCQKHARANAIFHHGRAQLPAKYWASYDWQNPPPSLLDMMQAQTCQPRHVCQEALKAAENLHLIGGVGVGPVIVLRRGRELLASPMAVWATQCTGSGRLDGRVGQ